MLKIEYQKQNVIRPPTKHLIGTCGLCHIILSTKVPHDIEIPTWLTCPACLCPESFNWFGQTNKFYEILMKRIRINNFNIGGCDE